MTYVPDYMTPQPPPQGRAGLMVFGILTILIGAMAGCGSLMMPVAMVASKMAPPGTPAVDLGSVIVGMVIYIAVAAGFIWTGIGSCQCRRWVRPIVLCIAWPWMAIGVLSSIIVIPMLGNMPMPPNATTMTAMNRIIMIVVPGAIMVIMYILLPLAYIVYYQRRRVQETLSLCDPHTRWTERCPMPVLGLSIWLAIMALGSMSMLVYRCVPLFGTYVTGLPAVGLMLALCAAIVFAAWSCYHLRPIGWWTALLAIVGWCMSTILTFHITGIMEFYRHSGLPKDQLAFLEQQPFVHDHAPLFMAGAFGVVCTAYLLYVRRYFATAKPQGISMHTGT